jgi:hypothetical protein
MPRGPKPPPKEIAWTALAERRGGRVVTDRKGKVKEVRFRIEPFELVLDTYTVSTGNTSQTFTRGRILYPMRDEFRFKVYRRSIFTGIGKFFGMQDIEVGQPAVDRDYVIKAASAGPIQALLLQGPVSRALAALRAGTFETRKFKKRGVDTTSLRELRYEVSGVLREAGKLDAIIDLFTDTAEHLVKSGYAWAEPTPITL